MLARFRDQIGGIDELLVDAEQVYAVGLDVSPGKKIESEVIARKGTFASSSSRVAHNAYAAHGRWQQEPPSRSARSPQDTRQRPLFVARAVLWRDVDVSQHG